MRARQWRGDGSRERGRRHRGDTARVGVSRTSWDSAKPLASFFISTRVVSRRNLSETLPRLVRARAEATSRRAEVRSIAVVLEKSREKCLSCRGCPRVPCVSPARPRPRVSPRDEPSRRCHASSRRAELARPTREVEVARLRVSGRAPRAGARAPYSSDTLEDTPLPRALPPRRSRRRRGGPRG